MVGIQRTTIRDVAQRAGVSVATVSKVVNERYGVGADTIAVVRQVIDELGYESSLVASSLRGRTTRVLGVLATDLGPFGADLVAGAADTAQAAGYDLMVYCTTGEPGAQPGWERRSLSRLGGTLIDGALLLSPGRVGERSHVPAVAVEPQQAGVVVPVVAADHLGGALAATRHLIRLGHRRIGFVAGRPDQESSRLRRAGYDRALAEAGIRPDPQLVVEGGSDRDRSRWAAQALLVEPACPTAVFACDDASALGVLDTAGRFGLEVPEDLSLIGFDDLPEAALAQPGLTTVARPSRVIGQLAAELLLAQLEGRPVAAASTIPVQLVHRASTAPPHP